MVPLRMTQLLTLSISYVRGRWNVILQVETDADRGETDVDVVNVRGNRENEKRAGKRRTRSVVASLLDSGIS
jgi:hypothetical protein